MKKPAYQWYPGDALSSSRILRMSLEEEGAYRRLIDYQWMDGHVTDNPVLLARMLKVSKSRAASIWRLLIELSCFVPIDGEPHKFVNPRISEMRSADAAYSKEQAGRASKRWNNSQKSVVPSDMPMHVQPHVQVECSSSSTSPSTSLRKGNKKERGADAPLLALGEFASVRITPEERRELIERLGQAVFDDTVDDLDTYSRTNPRKFAKYSDHYAVLKSWAKKHAKENANGKPKQSRFETSAEANERVTREAGENLVRRFAAAQTGNDDGSPDERGAAGGICGAVIDLQPERN